MGNKPKKKLTEFDSVEEYIADIYNVLYCLAHKYIIEKQLSMEEEVSIARLGELVEEHKHIIEKPPKKREKKASNIKPRTKLIFKFEEEYGGKTIEEEQLHPPPPVLERKKTKLFGEDVIVE